MARARRGVRGLSLVELMVASVLVLLLMGEVWMMLRAGTRFYLRVKSQTETQRSALIALRWLSKDLAESSPNSFRHYDPTYHIPTVHDGFVFGSLKDESEEIIYNEDSKILWTTVTCYYIDPVSHVLYRTKKPQADPGITAPKIKDADHHIDILAGLEKRRPIAHHVKDIESVLGPKNVKITLRCRDEELGYGLTVSTRLEMKN